MLLHKGDIYGRKKQNKCTSLQFLPRKSNTLSVRYHLSLITMAWLSWQVILFVNSEINICISFIHSAEQIRGVTLITEKRVGDKKYYRTLEEGLSCCLGRTLSILNENPFKRVFVWYLNKHLAEPSLIVVGLRNFCRLWALHFKTLWKTYGKNIFKLFINNIIWFFPDTHVLKVMAGKQSFVPKKTPNAKTCLIYSSSSGYNSSIGGWGGGGNHLTLTCATLAHTEMNAWCNNLVLIRSAIT